MTHSWVALFVEWDCNTASSLRRRTNRGVVPIVTEASNVLGRPLAGNHSLTLDEVSEADR